MNDGVNVPKQRNEIITRDISAPPIRPSDFSFRGSTRNPNDATNARVTDKGSH